MGDGPQPPVRPIRKVQKVWAKSFYCKTCDIRCTSAVNLKMHFVGAKHQRCKEARKNGSSFPAPRQKGEYKIMGKNTIDFVKRNVLTNDVRLLHGSSALEKHLRDADIQDPIIGLNDVIEYQSEVSPDPMFFCQLCKCHGEFSLFVSHIFGLKHRMTYISKMHPDILQRDGPKLKYPEWNAFVKEKAGDIEKIDGRGKVKVVLDEMPSGNTSTKRASDTHAPFDADFSPRENYRSSFHGDMENSYDARKRRQDGQSENKFSRHENFGTSYGSHLNRGHSNSYESRGPYSQDCRSSADVSQDSWRKDAKSEVPDMDWSSENTRNFDDESRRRDLKRDFPKNDSETSTVDHRWMRNEYETDRMEATTFARLNEELFKYLLDFEIFNDSDASFVLKIIQSLMDRLMEYRQKTNTIEEKRPPLHEEIRRPTGIPDRGIRRPSGIMDGDRRPPSGITDGERRSPSGIMDEGLRRPFGIMDDGIRKPYGATDYRSGYESRSVAKESRQRFPRYTGNSAGYGPKYKGGVTWKKAVGLQFKANRKNKIFPPNRKYIRPAPCDTGMTKSKGSPNLTPHQHKDIRGMDINQATKTLTKLSKINPSLKGLKVSSLVDVLVEAGMLTHAQD